MRLVSLRDRADQNVGRGVDNTEDGPTLVGAISVRGRVVTIVARIVPDLVRAGDVADVRIIMVRRVVHERAGVGQPIGWRAAQQNVWAETIQWRSDRGPIRPASRKRQHAGVYGGVKGPVVCSARRNAGRVDD